MNGPIGLHGGGEYVAGDEPFLDALLDAAAVAAGRRVRLAGPDAGPTAGLDAPPAAEGFDVSGHVLGAAVSVIRVVLVPTAAGRGLPDRAAATGRAAFERRALASGREATVDVARVVDAASAADPILSARLADADLIHLPGGDPDLVPATLAGTPALEAILTAWRRGAVVAGASAGAMGLGEWTWTSDGGIRGLGLVGGLVVVPHYDDVRRTAWQQTLDGLAPGGIGYLGLDERTGVISLPDDGDGKDWLIAGAGAAYWFPRGAAEPLIGRHGDHLRLAT
jgi:cyanophycinase